MGKQKDILEKLAETFQIGHVILRQALAECLGTLILAVSKENCIKFSVIVLYRKVGKLYVGKLNVPQPILK